MDEEGWSPCVMDVPPRGGERRQIKCNKKTHTRKFREEGREGKKGSLKESVERAKLGGSYDRFHVRCFHFD